MPKRGKQMSYAERLACVQQAAAGKTDEEIALERGWSSWVVRKWRQAYQKAGEAGLVSPMGRPKRGSLSAYPAQLRDALERLRREHMGWGPITLIEELRQMPAFAGAQLPSRARVAAFLKEKNLARQYGRRGSHPGTQPRPAQQPHEVWELDAQGQQPVAGVGEVRLVNIVDLVSRVKVESYPQVWGRGVSGADYQWILRRAFVSFGLPQRISLDHDSAFFDNTSASPYPTRLHLWLLGLGIAVEFIQQPPPLQHSVIERMHQTMTAQALTGQDWKDPKALWYALDQRRDFLNQQYPSRSLANQAPLERFPQARHSGRSYRPEWEADLIDLRRIYSFLSQGTWLRETNLHGEFWLGMQRYNAGRTRAYTTQQLTFDPSTNTFIARTVGAQITRSFPAKGLSKLELMGDLFPIARLPNYQLVLPFSREDWRHNAFALLATTTT